MRRQLATTAFALFVSGCAAFTNATPQLKLQIAQDVACNAWVKSLNIATAYRRAGDLSIKEIDRVNFLRKIVSPVCNSRLLSAQTLVTGVETAVEELLIMQLTKERK